MARRTTNGERRTSESAPESPIVAEEGAAAHVLVDKAIAAKGGLDTLRAVKSITARTHASMVTPEGKVEAQTTTYLQYPNRMRVETTLAGATIIQTFDGSRAFVKDRGGVHEVPERMVRDLEATFKRDTIAALLAAHDKQIRARLLPNVKDEAGIVRQVVELSGAGLEPLVMYLDLDSSQVVKLAYVVNGPGKPLVEEIFSDHRPVDGVQVAFSASVRQDGRAVIERKVLDIKINAPLDSTLFQRPGS